MRRDWRAGRVREGSDRGRERITFNTNYVSRCIKFGKM
jgi:hypothetical protein